MLAIFQIVVQLQVYIHSSFFHGSVP